MPLPQYLFVDPSLEEPSTAVLYTSNFEWAAFSKRFKFQSRDIDAIVTWIEGIVDECRIEPIIDVAGDGHAVYSEYVKRKREKAWQKLQQEILATYLTENPLVSQDANGGTH
jgi:hypothetical protein